MLQLPPLLPMMHSLGQPERFSDRTPAETWFKYMEFYCGRLGVAPGQLVDVALQYMEPGTLCRVRSAHLDEVKEWKDFKTQLRALFGRTESHAALMDRLHDVEQRADEP